MDKVYVWSWKIRESQFWEFYTVWLKLEELEKYVNEKGYVNIIINKRKTPDNYWNDLSVAINSFKPKPKEEIKKELNEFWDKKIKDDHISIEDIPF